MTRLLAIDWSGDRDARTARQKIWLAEVADGRLVRLEAGRDRDQLVDYLIAEATGSPEMVVGFDFAFSLPAWFLAERGLRNAHELWALVAREGERWLAGCSAPFWGRAPGQTSRPDLPAHFRRTEEDARRVIQARGQPGGATSVFQLVGPSQVGPGSLRGMPILYRLHHAGFSIWPFDRPGRPTVVEIYPRLLADRVTKSDPVARVQYFTERHPDVPMEFRLAAASSDDAFDAAVSVLAMAAHSEDLAHLPVLADPQLRLEGSIWTPA